MSLLLEHIEQNIIKLYLNSETISESAVDRIISKLKTRKNITKQIVTKLFKVVKTKLTESEQEAKQRSNIAAAKAFAAIIGILVSFEAYMHSTTPTPYVHTFSNDLHAVIDAVTLKPLRDALYDYFHTNTPFEEFKSKIDNILTSDDITVLVGIAAIIGLIWSLYKLIVNVPRSEFPK